MKEIYLLFLQYFILYFGNVARKSTFLMKIEKHRQYPSGCQEQNVV